jgi:hypothetical protein
LKGWTALHLLRFAVVSVVAGLLLTACSSSGNTTASSSGSTTTSTQNSPTPAASSSTGTASDQVVFTITGSASGGVESHGDTAGSAGEVTTWNNYTVPLHATMPYQPPPAGPTRYTLFATFDSSGSATCTISLAGHTYTGTTGPGSNPADPKAQQICDVYVQYTGGFGWQQ